MAVFNGSDKHRTEEGLGLSYGKFQARRTCEVLFIESHSDCLCNMKKHI